MTSICGGSNTTRSLPALNVDGRYSGSYLSADEIRMRPGTPDGA
jgi:hypothetical protein